MKIKPKKRSRIPCVRRSLEEQRLYLKIIGHDDVNQKFDQDVENIYWNELVSWQQTGYTENQMWLFLADRRRIRFLAKFHDFLRKKK